MNKIIITIIILLSYHINLTSQVLETKNWCLSRCDIAGDEMENTELIYLQQRNDSIKSSLLSESIKKIPLRIGIIQTDTIDIELNELTIRRAIENLNKSFKETNLVFYISRTDVIYSKLKLEELSLDFYSPYNKFSDKYDLPNMISIYIFDHGKEFCNVNNEFLTCGKTGGFSYILSKRTSNLVMSRFDISDIKILAHEMGHFWGLYHTFEEAQFGADNFESDQCHLLGDRLCDTPPDPGPNYEVYVNYSTCELSNLKNKDGFDYKPLIQNYMSYFKPCYLKEYSFTPNQIEIIKLAAANPIRMKYIE